MRALGYWRHVRRYARRQTNEALFGSVQEAMIEGFSYLVWLITVWLVLAKQTGELKTELAIGIIASAAPVLVYPAVYFYKLSRVPAQLHFRTLKRQKRTLARLAALEFAPASDLSIEIMEDPIFSGGMRDADGKPLPNDRVLLVRVANIGKNLLRNCQLTIGQGPFFFYFASEPVDLRPGEPRELPILHLVKERDGSERAHMYFRRPADWKISGGSWLVAPGVYDIKALSNDTTPFAAKVSINCELKSGVWYDWTFRRCF